MAPCLGAAFYYEHASSYSRWWTWSVRLRTDAATLIVHHFAIRAPKQYQEIIMRKRTEVALEEPSAGARTPLAQRYESAAERYSFRDDKKAAGGKPAETPSAGELPYSPHHDRNAAMGIGSLTQACPASAGHS